MKRPVYDALVKLAKEDSISFHMPGHKGKNTLFNWGDLIPAIDTTETYGMDNLLDSKGIIKESEIEAAKMFGTKSTYYAVNGSTGSMYIAVATITKPHDKVLVQRNCHKCVYNALIHNDLEPVYVFPNYNSEHHVITGVTPESIIEALDEHPDITAVILTHPNYYGVCSDMEKISEIIHERGKILLVDEAHGPHMRFSEKCPPSAIECGADIVIHSTHKTLGGFTQTSMIHVNSDRIDERKLKDMFQLYTTTSPSYLFTLSNETAVAYMDGEGKERLEKNVEWCREFTKKLKQIDRVTVFEGDENDKSIKYKDETKILFKIDGITGGKVRRLIYEKHNIRLEMSDYYYSLVFATFMNEKEDYDKLLVAIEDIAKNEPAEELEDAEVKMPDPKIVLSPWTAYFKEREQIKVEDALGRVVASAIIPYPPGIPLLAAGEEVTPEILRYLNLLKNSELNIVGLIGEDEDELLVVKE